MTTKTTLACIAAALALAAAAGKPALAQSYDDAAITVSYADLNLASESGASTLLHRIHTAAVMSCGAGGVMPLDMKRVYDLCVQDRVDHAVATVHSPLLTALNSGRAPATVLAAR
jgi:UrcA family protein